MFFKINGAFYDILSRNGLICINLKLCFNLYHSINKRNECIVKSHLIQVTMTKLSFIQ